VKITYDPAADVLRVVFSPAPIDESHKNKLGLILDYEKDGNIVG
jgi:uncharacterized protein YuzE